MNANGRGNTLKNLLIVDDEKSICNVLKFAFENIYNIYTANNLHELNNIIKNNFIDIVLLDLKFGSISGIDLLDNIKLIHPEVIVIMMTAYGTIETSIQAIKKGAYDYILKPIELEKLKKLVENALRYQELQRKIFTKGFGTQGPNINIIGKSAKIQKVLEMIQKVKDLDVNVLIYGESGTGKDLVARAIHYNGKRKDMPFQVINCGAMPQNLIESELFGYEKGAFTGADKTKKGLFEIADKGSIFLDEIGDMDLYCQVKLLRTIQQKEIKPLGSNITKKIDVRIIAATNKDLQKEIEDGNFRKDLYYRLNILSIYVPSLNERPEDIPLLIEYFINKANDMYNLNIQGISKGTLEKLKNKEYVGNIRELENIIYRACILSDSDFIEENLVGDVECSNGNLIFDNFVSVKLGTKLEDVERQIIMSTLEFVNGNKAKAAKLLGISERSIYYKIRNYGEEII